MFTDNIVRREEKEMLYKYSIPNNFGKFCISPYIESCILDLVTLLVI